MTRSAGRRLDPLKIIEQQLAAALTSTPMETDFYVSAAVLQSIGLGGREQQAAWLERIRPARETRTWWFFQDQWAYSGNAPGGEPAVVPAMNWRTTPSISEPRANPIVVKPLVPLSTRKPPFKSSGPATATASGRPEMG